VEPKVEVVKPAQKRVVKWRQRSDGGWECRLEGENMVRRHFGPRPKVAQKATEAVPQLKVVEAQKPEPELEPAEPKAEKAEIKQGEIKEVKSGLVDEIARLELELADKRAQSLVVSDYGLGYLTPGMAAQKPVVVLNELNKKHAVITNLGGKCVVMEWATSQVDPQWEELS